MQFESCYRAVAARDSRFDGLFYTAVKTTGIYCRPVCPARTPARSNCKFFSTPAAAEQAGFRPCLRCRPELAPGRPDFSATLAQSIYQRLAAGALDQMSMDALSVQVGVSTRHMRRLLIEHFGVTPIEVAQTQRLLFAKKLLHETTLPMTEVALAAGFGSVRRFNAAFLSRYRLSPSSLRGQSKSNIKDATGSVTLRLQYRPPFAASYWLAYLAARAIDGVESADQHSYRRAVRIEHGERSIEGWFEIRADPTRHALQVTLPFAFTPVLLQATQRIRRLFDLDADPNQIGDHLDLTAPLGGRPVDRRHLRVPGSWDVFELSLRTVIGQQVSVRGASTLTSRIAQRFSQPLSNAPDGLRLLPLRAEDLKAATEGELCALGLTRQRAATVVALTQFALRGGLNLPPQVELDQVIERLGTVRGIGEWTAQYIAMRGFAQADAFPAGDLGLRRALARLDGHADLLPSERQVFHRSCAWRPWRAYVASALWATLKEEIDS